MRLMPIALLAALLGACSGASPDQAVQPSVSASAESSDPAAAPVAAPAPLPVAKPVSIDDSTPLYEFSYSYPKQAQAIPALAGPRPPRYLRPYGKDDPT